MNRSLLYVLMSAATATATLVNAADIEQGVMEETVVKGSKLNSTLESLPSSVSVITEQRLEKSRIGSITDLDRIVPNIKFNQLGEVGSRFISIRGVSSNPLIQNRTAVYIDDIPFRAINDQLLVDINQIEVLRGPQGTLYGANTEGGVIVATTAPIPEEFHAKTKLTTEHYDQGSRYHLAASASGHLTDNLGARLAFHSVKGDAYTQNQDPTTDNKGEIEDFSILAGIQYQITDQLEVAIQYMTEINRAPGLYELQYTPINYKLYNDRFSLNATRPDALPVNTKSIGKYELHMDDDREFDEDEHIGSIRINYENSWGRLVSISTYKDSKESGYGAQFDLSSIPIVNTGGSDRSKEFFQEIRLESDVNPSLKWVAGISYLNVERALSVELKNIILGETRFRKLPEVEERNKDAAVFANARFAFFEDTVGLTLGGRYEHAQRRVNRKEVGRLGAIEFPIINESETYTKFLPKVALDFQLSKNTHAYISVAEGWQPGGFNDDAYGVDAQLYFSYDAEKIWNYEFGFKGTLLEGDIFWSSSVYYSEAKDWQEFNFVTNPDGSAQSTSIVINAAELESAGAELELNWQVSSGLQVSLGLGYNDSEYKAFEFTSNQNFSGKKSYLMPKYTGNLSVDYETEFGWFIRTELSAYGDMYLNPENSVEQSSYELINSSLGWRSDEFTVSLYIDNLTDEYYFNGQAFQDFSFPTTDLYFSPPGAPRRYGLELMMHW